MWALLNAEECLQRCGMSGDRALVLQASAAAAQAVRATQEQAELRAEVAALTERESSLRADLVNLADRQWPSLLPAS